MDACERTARRRLGTVGALCFVALLAAAAVMPGVATAVTPTFAKAINFGEGPVRTAIVTADFDKDGKADLATANATTNNVTVFWGKNAWSGRTTLQVGKTPTWLATGDFNRDGCADLAVSCWDTNAVSILLGNGHGGFAPAKTVRAAGAPGFVAVADVNLDGIPDLLVDNGVNNTLAVMLGKGKATFSAPRVVRNCKGVGWKFAVADLNGDKKPDLIVPGPGGAHVAVLLGKGDGTFGRPNYHAVGPGATGVAVADVNRDGKPDVIVTDMALRSGSVQILLGKGDGKGGLVAAKKYAAAAGAIWTAVGDFNRDGDLDLAVANNVADSVSVLVGNGTGQFAAPITCKASVSPRCVVVGDLDQDDKADIAVANYDGNVSVITNTTALARRL